MVPPCLAPPVCRFTLPFFMSAFSSRATILASLHCILNQSHHGLPLYLATSLSHTLPSILLPDHASDRLGHTSNGLVSMNYRIFFASLFSSLLSYVPYSILPGSSLLIPISLSSFIDFRSSASFLKPANTYYQVLTRGGHSLLTPNCKNTVLLAAIVYTWRIIVVCLAYRFKSLVGALPPLTLGRQRRTWRIDLHTDLIISES